jgi:hypothetical protein
MARLDLWLGFEPTIITAQQQCSPSSLTVSKFMEHPAESEEIMVQRTLEWLSGWKRTKVEEEDLTYGEGPSIHLALSLILLMALCTRSVHNTRIERIWYDVTEGFGGKWKDFFTDLEANEGLDVNNPAHVWLLHHLFLDDINQDALAWAEAWNNHKLQFRGEPQQTPQEMFFFSMLEDGPRGLNGPLSQNRGEDPDRLEGEEDISAFGIDWEDMDDEALMEHHYHHNPIQPDNPFSAAPSTLSEVACTPPDCPLSAESIHQLNYHLSQVADVNSRSMLVRRTIWVEGLHVCGQIS